VWVYDFLGDRSCCFEVSCGGEKFGVEFLLVRKWFESNLNFVCSVLSGFLWWRSLILVHILNMPYVLRDLGAGRSDSASFGVICLLFMLWDDCCARSENFADFCF